MKTKKIISILLVFVLITAMTPFSVFASTQTAPAAMNEGTAALQRGINTAGTASETYSDGFYESLKNTTTVVYFDNKEWYLIDYDSSTVTLLSKECVATSHYNSNSDGFYPPGGHQNTSLYVEYSSSVVKTAVDNWYNTEISADAKTAVNGSGMFLLTTEQAYALSEDVRKCSKHPDAMLNEWWLCSPGGRESGAAVVDGDKGRVNAGGVGVGALLGVRPAIKLNALFASRAEGSKSSATAGSGDFGTIITLSGNAKLTLIDSSRSAVTANVDGSSSENVIPGGSLAVTYSGVTSGDCISALLCDESGAILYYASLTPDGSGVWNMTLPDTLTKGSTYTLKLFSEQQNGDFNTDYASAPTSIALKTVPYNVTLSASPVAGGTVTGGGTYDMGASVTVTATPADGYTFVNWTENGSQVSTDASYTFIATADRTLTANFARESSLIDGIPVVNGGYVYLNWIKWRVIGVSDTAWLLISAELLGEYRTWESAKAYCGDVFNGFSPAEQNAVKPTSKTDGEYTTERSIPFAATTLTDATLFLLSASEAEAYFISNADRQPGIWWLRSPRVNINGDAGIVTDGGALGNRRVGNKLGTRPAFQLNPESVLFASHAESGKSEATGDFITYTEPTAAQDRKLTLIDSNRPAVTANVAGASSATVVPGGSLAVTYSGVTNRDNISALLCDASGAIQYYASLTPDDSGVWNMTLPDTLTKGSAYTLKLFSERQNGKFTTNYASAPTSIALNVAYSVSLSASPVEGGTVTGGGTYASGTSVTVTATPANDHIFVNWTENGSVVSTDASYTFTATGDRTLTANFEWEPSLIDDIIPVANGGNVYVNGIKWRVIGVSDTAWLLISVEVLGETGTWENTIAYCGDVFNGFSAAEQSAVKRTSKTDGEYTSTEYQTDFAGTTLSDATLFLLSAWEAETYFSSNYDRQPGTWWLRSPSICNDGYSYAGVVGFVGEVRSNDVRNGGYYGARPAFQLNPESVLFASSAEGGKPEATGGFSAYTEPATEADRKLTLLDSSRPAVTANVAGASSATVEPGGSLAVTYSGVTSGDNISALLCDESGAILYYASLTPDSSGSGTWNMTLPDTLTGYSNYTLNLFSEQLNGDHNTDYAGTPTTITLTVPNTSTVTLTASPAAGGTVSGGGIYVDGVSVTVTATANDLYTFVNWTENGSVVSTDASYTFTATADLTLTANFGRERSLIDGIPVANGGFVYVNGIKWRVIGVSDTAWLLISAEVLGGDRTWESAKAYCSDVFNDFSAAEKNAVKPTSKTDGKYTSAGTGIPFAGTTLSDATLFLLSAWEAETYFSSDADRQPGWWWLRSPYFYNTEYVGDVLKEGYLNYFGALADSLFGARPAFQLNLGSVLFTSRAEGGKPEATGGFSTYTEPTTEADRKLTLLDSSRPAVTANVDGASRATVEPGGSLAVTYSGVTSGDNISALLCDKNGEILNCASLTTNASGVWNMTLPDTLTEGNYTLKLFSEQRNGDHETDYAGAPTTITLTVAPIDYTINITQSANGSVSAAVGGTANPATVHCGDIVTLTVTPNEGYAVKSVKYNDTAIEPVEGVYSFTMPAENVTVTADFDVESYFEAGTCTLTLKGTVLNGDNGMILPKGVYNYDVEHIDVDSNGATLPEDSSYLFNEFYNALTIDLKGANTSSVTNMSYMFDNCNVLTTVDLSGFDTRLVTDMSDMFCCCEKLTTIYAGDNWNTDRVTNSADMFNECSALTGGNGTACDGTNNIDKEYARIDKEGQPGYLTGLFALTLPGQMEIVTNASPNMMVGSKYLSGAVVTLRYKDTVQTGYVLKVKANGTELPEENGVYTVTVTENTEITATKELLIGDANLDGIVDIRDATTIQKHLAGLVTLEGDALAAADTDGSGTVDINDVTHLQKYIAKLDVVLGNQPV